MDSSKYSVTIRASRPAAILRAPALPSTASMIGAEKAPANAPGTPESWPPTSAPEALAKAPGVFSAMKERNEVPPKSWRVPYAASVWRAVVVSKVTGAIIAAEL